MIGNAVHVIRIATSSGLIENSRLLPFEDFAFEGDFADIETIAKQMRQHPRPRESIEIRTMAFF